MFRSITLRWVTHRYPDGQEWGASLLSEFGKTYSENRLWYYRTKSISLGNLRIAISYKPHYSAEPYFRRKDYHIPRMIHWRNIKELLSGEAQRRHGLTITIESVSITKHPEVPM